MFTTSSSSTQLRGRVDACQRRFAVATREWLVALLLDPRTRYLSKAADHADLERRLRAWDEQQRHQAQLLITAGHFR